MKLDTTHMGLKLKHPIVASAGPGRCSTSQRHVADPGAFERANYIQLLEGYRPA